ncbi:CBO0543 family protein [Metabacillus sp. RGM 3146]|uniref:CBO0543 family protein n=1 Tax=Metabacillus sp. RGM 3146 TaxID=3401092 RepID=UPI003B9B68AD
MKDRTILNLITLFSMSGWSLLFRRKGEIKDWFLIYLFKTLVATLLDSPVINKKYVLYPNRYFPKIFDSNIVFLYIIFPLLCVIYNQFTYKMKPVKTILSVFLFSTPMTLFENWLEKNTSLVRYRKGWNSFFTFSVLTVTFWMVRLLIAWVRFLSKKQKSAID